MATTRRKTITIDNRKPTFEVKDGEVTKVDPPPVELSVEEEVVTEELPKYRITTSEGEAVYEYAGECKDCENEGVTTPIFRCITKIRADNEIGDQLAAGWNDGGIATPLCQKHYHNRTRRVSRPEAGYKVIEKRW